MSFKKTTFLIFFILISTASCAYHMGYENKALPANVKSVYIPIFENDSSETSLGMIFSNAFMSEVQESKQINVSKDAEHSNQMIGRVLSVTNSQINTDRRDIGSGFKSTGLRFLPEGSVLTTEYNIKVRLEIKILKNNKEVYRHIASDEIIYSAPRLSIEILNSSNPNYNDEARRVSLKQLAEKMSKEIFLKMTESF